MKILHKISFILVIVGGLNWLLVAFGYNLVDQLGSQLAMIVYILVGLSAIYLIVSHKTTCRYCVSGQSM